jgi:hypothetical protein
VLRQLHWQTVRQSVVDTARSYLGVKEKPRASNGGPMVETFLQEGCGLGPGYAWCACFAGYVLDQTDAEKPDFRTALSVDWMDRARERNLVRAKSLSRGIAQVPEGSIGAYERGQTESGHTVLSSSRWSGQCGPTIEGNLNHAVAEGERCARPNKYFHLVGFYITR